MISIIKATQDDYKSIAAIGKVSVEESHRGSSSAQDMNEFLESNYNLNAIKEELNHAHYIYYIVKYNDKPAGFSKVVMNAKHPTIGQENVAKLDRLYLLTEFYGLRLGLALLDFNIGLAKQHNQSGIWLYTWIGNKRAIDFYLKAGFSIIGSHNYYVTETHYDVSHHMFLKFS